MPSMQTAPAMRADADRSERRHPITRTGDRDETGEEAVHRQARIPLPKLRIGEEHDRQTAGTRRERRVGRDAADTAEVHRRQRAAGVEPVPTEPEDHAADRGDRHVVTGRHPSAVPLELATETRTERDRAGQGDHAADGVHDGGAREVTERRVPRREPSVGTPHPVAEDRVDEAAHTDAVEQVAAERGTTDHGTGRDRAARVGERELEQEEREERDSRRAVGHAVRCSGRRTRAR